jgi:hypothetical protein
VIEKLDGKTSGPGQSAGPIGQAISGKLYQAPVVNFTPIPTKLTPIDKNVEKDLSRDQALLRGYMTGIACGKIDSHFVNKIPGPVFHARWLTTATRILILYSREPEPSPNLCTIVRFIQEVYGPFWFEIKKENNFSKGPKIILEMSKAIKTFPAEVQEAALPSLRRNSFCLYPENYLACLLFSGNEEHRSKAVSHILQIRKNKGNSKLRIPQIPDYDIDCEDWGNMIDLSSIQLCEPPCVAGLSDSEITDMVKNKREPPNFPLHSQSVERAVKVTSEVSKLAVNLERRNQLALGKLESRKIRASFKTKRHYKLKHLV